MRRRRFWLGFSAAVAVAFVGGYLVGRGQVARPAPADSAPPASVAEVAPPEAPPPRPVERAYEEPSEAPVAPPPAPIATPQAVRPGGGSRVALVIDDLGRDVGDVDAFERLGVPIAYGVLPFEVRTREVVAELARRRLEYLCHLPMEPESDANPGPGALTMAMSSAELRRATRRALEAVKGAAGVNNHMGSGLTARPRSMRAILSELEGRSLFYLDSRTSAASVGFRAAVELGLPAAERDVFLDVDPAPEAIRFQFRRLLDLARREGAAIAIGHPYPATIRVLGEELPAAVAAGYEFVPVSYLVARRGGAG